MDDADYAEAAEAASRNDAIARARTAGPVKILSRCADCGERIPEKRRDLCRDLGIGCTRCVHCQQRHEKGMVR